MKTKLSKTQYQLIGFLKQAEYVTTAKALTSDCSGLVKVVNLLSAPEIFEVFMRMEKHLTMPLRQDANKNYWKWAFTDKFESYWKETPPARFFKQKDSTAIILFQYS